MSSDTRLSTLIADVLSGSWRGSPARTVISAEELELIAPLLIGSGGGALAFWKIRGTELESTKAGQYLKQAYRLYTLHAAIHESEIKKVIDLLSNVGVEPILVKGWSMARQYPEPALRPYGDIDLFIHPEQYETAKQVLAGEEGRKYFVDLHRGADHLCDQPFEDLWERSFMVTPSFRVTHLGVNVAGDTQSGANSSHPEPLQTANTAKGVTRNVRVLSNEDHLRILCVHFLHHGAWRPAGLCDIGLVVEAHGSKFDWDVCLTKNRKRARWVECTVGLAHQLLGADISATPISSKAKDLPRWLVPAVMKEWENPVSVDHTVPPPLANRLTHPIETLKAIRRRWPPNPIQATVVTNGPFNEMPRIIFQAGSFFSRTAKFFASLPADTKESQKSSENRTNDK